MTKPSISQSQKRFQESLGSLFNIEEKTGKLLILKSSSDVGVMRNGGRNGARFAPQSFLSAFKKLNLDEKTRSFQIIEEEVAFPSEEMQDFSLAQANQSKKIGQLYNKFQSARLCHIGGGHDHIYPLLTALSAGRKHVVVINIDAHADTRTDSEGHSGTPFRQFADSFTGKFELFQIGLHAFANSLSTLEPLRKGSMSVLWREEVKNRSRVEEFFEKIQSSLTADSLVVFSLDADALDGSQVPGVSAVNANGLTFDELSELWQMYRNLKYSHAPVLGIYELNPVYDAPSMISMRRMSAFVYQTLKS